MERYSEQGNFVEQGSFADPDCIEEPDSAEANTSLLFELAAVRLA
jgi:hypothetical protein